MTIRNRERVLVIAPHPDDEVLGCGGTILKHLYTNDMVTICIVSVRNEPLFTKQMNSQQYIESNNSHKVLGIKNSVILDFNSVMLDQVPHNELNNALLNVVMNVQPTLVYIPFVGDIHLDHKLVAESALVACRPINGANISRIAMYETPSETEWNFPKVENAFIPNIYVDITNHIDTKIDAMREYKSQLKETPHPRSIEKIKTLASMRGGTVSLKYAEAFMLVRDII